MFSQDERMNETDHSMQDFGCLSHKTLRSHLRMEVSSSLHTVPLAIPWHLLPQMARLFSLYLAVSLTRSARLEMFYPLQRDSRSRAEGSHSPNDLTWLFSIMFLRRMIRTEGIVFSCFACLISPCIDDFFFCYIIKL